MLTVYLLRFPIFYFSKEERVICQASNCLPVYRPPVAKQGGGKTPKSFWCGCGPKILRTEVSWPVPWQTLTNFRSDRGRSSTMDCSAIWQPNFSKLPGPALRPAYFFFDFFFIIFIFFWGTDRSICIPIMQNSLGGGIVDGISMISDCHWLISYLFRLLKWMADNG